MESHHKLSFPFSYVVNRKYEKTLLKTENKFEEYSTVNVLPRTGWPHDLHKDQKLDIVLPMQEDPLFVQSFIGLKPCCA